MSHRPVRVAIAAVAIGIAGHAGATTPVHSGSDSDLAAVRRWNEIAGEAVAIDHTPTELFPAPEQAGPTRSSRALAIVHIAVFDALNAVAGGPYQSYTGAAPVTAPTSAPAAIAQAAHDTLAALYARQRSRFDLLLAEDLAAVTDSVALRNGVALGQAVAAAILAARSGDGSERPDPVVGVDFFPSEQPGKWRPDPVSQSPLALGAYWGEVKPFVLPSRDAVRYAPPPPLTSLYYAAAFAQVKRLGGDGVVTPTARTRDQTLAGIYWAYDGTPLIGTPPRLFNQIVVQVAAQLGSDGLELARLLALVNVGMADAAIVCWREKYAFQYWRPVTGIREADPRTGPTGAGDHNPLTRGDPSFTPLGSPASNTQGLPNFTPPFPSYASGHAVLGGTVFQTLRWFFRTDAVGFTFVSDELNGRTRDATGAVRPLAPRSFSSFSQAEWEVALSRVWLGVHWSFDAVEGISVGRRVAAHVLAGAFRPVRERPPPPSVATP